MPSCGSTHPPPLPRTHVHVQVTPEGVNLVKGAARIQVDVLPLPDGSKATAVNYFRENTQWLQSPVSPLPPTQMP
jgi:hypothetical protein